MMWAQGFAGQQRDHVQNIALLMIWNACQAKTVRCVKLDLPFVLNLYCLTNSNFCPITQVRVQAKKIQERIQQQHRKDFDVDFKIEVDSGGGGNTMEVNYSGEVRKNNTREEKLDRHRPQVTERKSEREQEQEHERKRHVAGGAQKKLLSKSRKQIRKQWVEREGLPKNGCDRISVMACVFCALSSQVLTLSIVYSTWNRDEMHAYICERQEFLAAAYESSQLRHFYPDLSEPVDTAVDDAIVCTSTAKHVLDSSGAYTRKDSVDLNSFLATPSPTVPPSDQDSAYDQQVRLRTFIFIEML